MNECPQCPSSEQLRQLIEQTLPDQQQDECTDHLTTCIGCQTKLEAIATEGSNLSQVVDHLHDDDPMATSAYWPALNALTTDAPAAIGRPPSARVATRNRTRSLDFLEPASDPAFLGRLAHFDVMRVLGQGGMGVVVEAFDTRLQRNVAVKILDPDLAEDEVARQRFCREARAAASITHENVVAVHQVEKANDGSLPYLVMQLVSGESLEQRLHRVGQLPMREVIRISMQASQGLAAAHAQGLIHRDIKPGNILLEQPSDRVKLTDFGLARVAEDTKLTRTGFVTGTPLYMAPEQALGEEADARSDLFSLGAVLYEMCAGQPPFAGNSAPVILKQIVEARQRPLQELNPSVPKWLAGTIDRLLSKKPADRIQSAAHLAELFEFEWALMKTSSEEVPTVCDDEMRRWTNRSRRFAAAVGAASLAVGLLGGMFLLPHGHSPVTAPIVAGPVSTAEPTAVLSANAGAVRSVSFSPAGDAVAMAIEDGSVRVWDLATKSVKYTFSAQSGAATSALFAHHDDILATTGADGLVKLWNTSQPEPLKTFEHRSAIRALAFSLDDQTLYAGDIGGTVRVWPVKADHYSAEAHTTGAIYAVALSPAGDLLATGGTDKIIYVRNAKTLTQKLVLEGHAGPINGLAFDSDGKHLVSVGWDKTIRIWNVASGQLVKSWLGEDGAIGSVAYSPDGKSIATGSNSAVKLWSADTGHLLATYLGHDSAVQSVAFNAAGTLLASGGVDGAVRIWSLK